MKRKQGMARPKSCLGPWRVALLSGLLAFLGNVSGQPLLTITNINVNGSQKNLRFQPYPSAQSYRFYSAEAATGPFSLDGSFIFAPYVASASTNATNYSYEWRTSNARPSGFYFVEAVPMAPDALLSANALNRLAYGPTPDELERISSIGPYAWINEQLAMEGIPETIDNYVSQVTNSVSYDASTNWTNIRITGRLSGLNLYLFLTQAGQAYIDDIVLVEGTNGFEGINLVANGDFESALSPSWTVNGTASGSSIVSGIARSGNASLRLSSTAAGSTSANYLRQTLVTSLTNNSPVSLSYWYLPATNSNKLKVQLSGSGLISSAANLPPRPEWLYAQATGTAGSSPYIYLYLSASGECYLDDIKLVAGSVAGTGANLLQNSGFESGSLTPWTLTPYFAGSGVSSNYARTGAASLRITATGAGSSSLTNCVYQNVVGLANGQTYTVSYWYLPARPGANLNVRLSGNQLTSSPDTDSTGALYRRLSNQRGDIGELQAWFSRHAVESPRQLLEVLSQFWENHFVTYYTKSRDYLGGFSYDSGLRGRLAVDWEFREMTKWRNAMLSPECTFYDLLRISAESPAMIVYLDTVGSRGDANLVANENYARELLELFTFGVDNGYDQEDIVRMSRAWTGWSVDIVDPENADNPLAPISTTYYPNANSTSKSNLVGVWSFVYKSSNHGTNRGPIFPGRTVPARFGSPWAGRNYQLTIPPRTGSAGIQDGYDVLTHLANQPFTQEYISIKLCRLLVHDNFPNPTTDPSRPEYSFYDYTNPMRSAEAELVRQCMLAWEYSDPKGQIRPILATIFDSALFQEHRGVSQKVKTPFEFVASSVRALRSPNTDGTFTSGTDGYAFATPLLRMGSMELFDREAPDGYPESGPPWISAGTLTERIRFIQSYCTATGSGRPSDAGNNTSKPVTLLKKKLPSSQWSNAGAVVDYFLGILYPAEGAANLAPHRAAAIRFLDTADDGVTASTFANLSNTSTTYDTRVRGMVSMLMTLEIFNEQ